MSIILQALKKVEHQHAIERGTLIPGQYTSVEMVSRSSWSKVLLVIVMSTAMLSLGLVIGQQEITFGSQINNQTDTTASSTALVAPISEPVVEMEAAAVEHVIEKVADVDHEDDALIAEPNTQLDDAPTLQKPVYFSQLPTEIKQDLVELKVDVHYYHEVPDQRFVIISQHRYTEGEQFGDGVLLVEIIKEGVVLEYMNKRFILSRI
ncbi:MAG: general secretion pathway protein GspB [Sedimenticola sp.]